MKKILCGLLSGIIIGTSTSVFAYNTQMIEAVFGKVNLVVNGKAVNKETLLYNGTTYIPLRAAGEALGMAVSYDAQTNTAYIGETNLQLEKTNSNLKYYVEVPWALDMQRYVSLDLVQKYPTDNGYSYVYSYKNITDKNTFQQEIEDYFTALFSLGYKTTTAGDIIMFTKIENGVGKDITIMALDDRQQFLVNVETFMPQSTSSNDSYITLSEFNAIQEGMSYSEVVNIIGADGELISESTSGEYTSQLYMWISSDFSSSGGNAMILFNNGEVMTKAQTNLK